MTAWSRRKGTRFAEGDIVQTIAKKHAADWHGYRGQIVAGLTGYYKVKMLEGPQREKCHKFQFKHVHALEEPGQTQLVFAQPAAPANSGAAPAPPGAAGSAPAVKTEPPIMPTSKPSMTLLDMKDLFDEDSLM